MANAYDADNRSAVMAYIVKVTGDASAGTSDRWIPWTLLLILLLELLLVVLVFSVWEYIHQRQLAEQRLRSELE